MTERRFDSEIRADIAAVETRKVRALTDVVLGIGDPAEALARLTDLEAQLVVLRAEFTNPP